jgi:hypothetical protein
MLERIEDRWVLPVSSTIKQSREMFLEVPLPLVNSHEKSQFVEPGRE